MLACPSTSRTREAARCRHIGSPGSLAGSIDHRSRRLQHERAPRAPETMAAPGAATRRRSGRPRRRAARAVEGCTGGSASGRATAARRARRWRRRAAVAGRSRSRAGSAEPKGMADAATPRAAAAATPRRVQRPSRRRHACALRTRSRAISLARMPRERALLPTAALGLSLRVSASLFTLFRRCAATHVAHRHYVRFVDRALKYTLYSTSDLSSHPSYELACGSLWPRTSNNMQVRGLRGTLRRTLR